MTFLRQHIVGKQHGFGSIHRLVHMYHMFSSQSSASGIEHMYMYIVVEQWYVYVCIFI